ncbi:putative exported protein precursor [Bosea sp. LC85]|uniref:ABC transporter substrate-binding protein n=1 Tax=Bosea sp. LC85 TaxID=1502851 RepID=UPI0004E2CF97|nr:ABC transporter substrate-binding protein [Bosea sp. LC85]KFC72759.1 putative exported protein precursor [Bosea sp. LC85]
MKRRQFMAAAAGLPLALAASRVHSQAQDELTIVYPSPGGLGYFALYAAIGEGYFAEEKLKIQPRSVNGSAQAIQALLAGQAQLAHPGPGPLMAARERGQDLVYVYNYFTRSQFNLVVPEASPFQKPTDLKGKVIGVGTADGAEVAFVRSIFDADGMKEGQDYKFITVGEGGMAVAGFMQKAIDAYASDTAGAATLTLRGVKLRSLTPPPFQSFFGNGYVVTRKYLDENRNLLERFGRALVRGTKFGIDPANRAATLKHARMGNPQQLENMPFAEALLDVYYKLTSPIDPAKGFGYNHPAAWEMWQQTLVASGDLKKPLPDLTRAYSNDLVTAWNAPR